MMKKSIIILIHCLLLSILPWFANAQGQTETSWSLERCIEHAITNNITVMQRSLDIEIQESNLQQANHARYPNINGFANHNYNWGRSFDVYTNLPVTARVRSNSFGVSSSMTLFNGFNLTNSVKQSKINVDASEQDLQKAKNDVALNVANAFLQVLFNRELLANAERQLANTEEQVTRTEKLVRGGTLPETNLLELLSQKATNEVQVINAQNSLELSILQLKQLLQLPDEQAFELSAPPIPDPDANLLLPPSSEIYKSALTVMPEIQSAELQVQSSDIAIEIAKSNYYPTITLNGNINTFYSSAQAVQASRVQTGEQTVPIGYVINPINDPNLPAQIPVFSDIPVFDVQFNDFGFRDQLQESLRKSIGVSMQIPIYNRNQIKTAVSNARVRFEQSRLSSQQLRNQLRQDIEIARQNSLAASKTYDANRRQVESLRETYRIVEQRYNVGAANITEYTIAQTNLNAAESDLLRAKYDYTFKLKILDFYQGKPLKL